jgi:hypothetical protein
MNTKTLLIAASVTLLPVTGALAADQEGSDATAASVAALKANLRNTGGLQIDEVRLTEAGVACINYRVNNDQGGKSRGHAVVQGDEVLKSSTGFKQFEKAWNEHCLGPRGGNTSSAE